MTAPLPLRLCGLVLLGGLLAGCAGDDAEADAPVSPADAASETHDAHDEGHAWSYDDVDAWGETCASGTEQSPIDLADATEEDLADLELDYRAAPAQVVDNGHTIQADIEDGGTLTRDGVTYTLAQFHLHAPSEHLLDGEPYPAELHLVHQAEDGALAVLGVLVEEGDAHPVVADVLASAPEAGADPIATTAPIDVGTLLPADLRTFRYDGSLTTPPCSEGVAWSVLQEPMTWSAEQIAAFEERHPGSHRPPQPLGARALLHDTD